MSAEQASSQTNSDFWLDSVTCFPREHVHRGPRGPSRTRGRSKRSLGERDGWGRRSLPLWRGKLAQSPACGPGAAGMVRGAGAQASRARNPDVPPPPARLRPPTGSSSHPRRSAAIMKSNVRRQSRAEAATRPVRTGDPHARARACPSGPRSTALTDLFLSSGK